MATTSPSSTNPRNPAQVTPPARAQTWNAGRRPLAIVVGLTLVAVIAMAMSVAFTRPYHAVPWTLDDPQFLTDANNACSTSLPAARPSSVPAMTSGTASPSPSVLTRWASTVNGVSARIRVLPSAPYDVERLNTWLGEWSTYSMNETRYATWLRSATKPLAPAQAKAGRALVTSLTQEALEADSFANTNGLDDCTLGSTGATATPSQ